MSARYDGLAEWYDEYIGASAGDGIADVARLLGPGDGLCLDLGCGTGLYLDAIRSTGRTPVGLDRSADQLGRARRRDGAPLLQGDAAALPFPDATFATVTAIWVSTDIPGFPAVLREAARVLRPGGLLLFYGVHPCFNGPHIEPREDGAVVIHPTYRTTGWHRRSPWWREGGVRDRLGMSHVPLADLLNAFVGAGLAVERAEEPGERPVPMVLALRARRP
ncbi:class I SAM-dependent methyltransferase [Actinomadura sp. ATCC 31491]|uniref:Class I SAM-dependent methyltransferase n=1 Tax=Actinomadura luzonensis TaxID=2805427 RepID=A0ABT0FYG7_9ACTN|nr:class I SAM-dependent methyltransferase [Actinomadura luzonensis]MCK2216931.1 class I SAM-dependent methyltransferase [Actinomadura luzonensis]